MRLLKKLLLFMVASALAGSVWASEPVTIRLGYVVPVSNWAPLLVRKKDIAKHWGETYNVEIIRFRGTPPMITGLATGELDVATLAYSTLNLAINNAGLDDLRIIADGFQDGVPGYYSNEYFVRKDSNIHAIEDLRGQVLAVNALGAGVHIAMLAALKKHGLIAGQDYTVIEAPFPTMGALLVEGKADLVTAVPPFSFSPVFEKHGRVLFEGRDGLGVTQFLFWTALEPFLLDNRAAMVDFMTDVLRIQRWYLDPDNHEKVAKIASEFLHMPPESFGWLFTHQDYYRSPNGIPNLEALQNNVDTATKLGVFAKSIDVSDYADLSIVNDALERIGRVGVPENE